MQITARPAAPAPLDTGSPDLLAGIARLATRAWRSGRRALDLARRRRYTMRHEDLLRGPLSDEIRRATWL